MLETLEICDKTISIEYDKLALGFFNLFKDDPDFILPLSIGMINSSHNKMLKNQLKESVEIKLPKDFRELFQITINDFIEKVMKLITVELLKLGCKV